jgi:hypothetical protein
MARRYPEVTGLTSWVTSVYQARAEVVNPEEGEMLNTSLSPSWETCTSPPSNVDGRTIIREANVPCDFSVLWGS